MFENEVTINILYAFVKFHQNVISKTYVYLKYFNKFIRFRKHLS